MNNYYKHICVNGMTAYLIKKEGYNKSYCGIGTKFGGSNLKFEENGKIYNIKPGTAHFLEHKLFAQEDGTDAFNTFTKLNAMANAYTANDKTIYYFTTNDDLKKPLSLLLNMYFNPYFTDSNVSKEKDIIISEYNTSLDVGFLFNNKLINDLYPNDDYSKMILGDIEDIKSITKEDLYQAYNAFYTPLNSVLYIVSDINPDLLFNFIDEELKKYKYSNLVVKKLNILESKKPKCDLAYFVDERISQKEICINLRLDDVTNKDPISCELLLGVFEALLNVSGKIYKKLEHKKLLLNDIDFNVNTFSESSTITLSFTTNNPLKINKIMTKIIRKIDKIKLNQDYIEIYFRHLKAKSIIEEDQIGPLGEKCLSLALEDIDYFDMTEKLINLDKKDINKYINSIKNSMIYSLIAMKKN